MNSEESEHFITIVAHRGASKLAPENTLKSFKKAIEFKADYIEFDVRKTKDGHLLIMHDPNTFRTTKHFGWVKRMTLEKLKKLSCNGTEKIPTLKEVIELTKGKIKLLCEIKVRGITQQLIEILKESDALDSAIVISFKHDQIFKIRESEHNLKSGLIEPAGVGWVFAYFFGKRMVKKALKNDIPFLIIRHEYLSKKLVKFAHENKLKVFTWTVDSKKKIRKVRSLGIDGILTNDILTANSLLR